jgi:hypothetical protein
MGNAESAAAFVESVGGTVDPRFAQLFGKTCRDIKECTSMFHNLELSSPAVTREDFQTIFCVDGPEFDLFLQNPQTGTHVDVYDVFGAMLFTAREKVGGLPALTSDGACSLKAFGRARLPPACTAAGQQGDQLLPDLRPRREQEHARRRGGAHGAQHHAVGGTSNL